MFIHAEDTRLARRGFRTYVTTNMVKYRRVWFRFARINSTKIFKKRTIFNELLGRELWLHLNDYNN